MLKIQGILSELNEAKKKVFYYEAVRGENRLGVKEIPNHNRPSVKPKKDPIFPSLLRWKILQLFVSIYRSCIMNILK